MSAVIRHPLAKTFIHMLRLRNPALARVVEETPRLTPSGQRKRSKRENLNAKLDKTFERVSPAHQEKGGNAGVPAAQVSSAQQSSCALQSCQASLERHVQQLSCSDLSPSRGPCQPSAPWLQVTRLVLLSLLLYVWRQIPYIGRLAAPVMHFSTMQRNLGHQRALALSAVGLVPWLEPCVVRSASGMLCCSCLPWCALACST